MRAIVLERQAPIESAPLREVELAEPEPGPGQVRVRVSCCAVCRTDLHLVEGDLPLVRSPIVPGHQVVGTVDRLGPECDRLAVGQRVGIGWLRWTDGTCPWCRRGRENLCPESRYTGYHADGGFAELAVVPEAFAYELPDAFDDVHAAPLLCGGLIGYRALARAEVPERGSLLLVGFGSSAHLVLQLARHRGLDVRVATRAPEHQALARQLGASWAGDLDELPEPVDSAILFAPAGGLVPPILAGLRRGGTLSLAGIHLSDIPSLTYQHHLYGERDIHPVTANTRDDGRALLAEAATAGVTPEVETYPLAEANRALDNLKASRIDGTGVLLVGG